MIRTNAERTNISHRLTNIQQTEMMFCYCELAVNLRMNIDKFGLDRVFPS